jgi:hypothetical protein
MIAACPLGTAEMTANTNQKKSNRQGRLGGLSLLQFLTRRVSSSPEKKMKNRKPETENGKPEIGPDRLSFPVCRFRFPVSSFLPVLVPARPG